MRRCSKSNCCILMLVFYRFYLNSLRVLSNSPGGLQLRNSREVAKIINLVAGFRFWRVFFVAIVNAKSPQNLYSVLAFVLNVLSNASRNARVRSNVLRRNTIFGWATHFVNKLSPVKYNSGSSYRVAVSIFRRKRKRRAVPKHAERTKDDGFVECTPPYDKPPLLYQQYSKRQLISGSTSSLTM